MDLLLVENLEFYYNYRGQTKARFRCNGVYYEEYAPTSFLKQYNYQQGMVNPIVVISNAYIVVSIAAVLFDDGFYYKFIAEFYSM